jgi:hypothetical protein
MNAGRERSEDSARKFAHIIMSAHGDDYPRKVLETVVLLHQTKPLARRVTHRIVVRLKRLRILERFHVAGRLCSFKTALWIPGDTRLETLLLEQLRRDFPPPMIGSLRKWAMQERPLSPRRYILLATWLPTLLDLAAATEGRRAKRAIHSMNRLFTGTRYALLRPPFARGC